MRWSHALLFVVASLLSTGCGYVFTGPFTPPEAGGAPWVEVVSEHFHLQSDLEAPAARAAVEELERMHATLVDVAFNHSIRPTRRTRVILFRRSDEYRPVAPPGTAGYFAPSVWLGGEGDEPMAVLFGSSKAAAEVLQHELTHRFVRFYYPKAPPWLNEGLAHYYQTLSFEDGNVVMGYPPFIFGASHAGPRLLGPSALPSVRAILRFRPGDINPRRASDPDEQHRVFRNRAGAWALVYLFKNGPDRFQPPFQRLLERLADGATFEDAWADLLRSVDVAGLDAAVAAALPLYGERMSILTSRYTPPPAPILEERAMLPAEVHLLWGALRGLPAEVEAGLRLAPTLPLAWRMSARVHLARREVDAAEQDMEKAAALDPGDVPALLDRFSFYAERAGAKDAPARYLEQAEALFPKLRARADSAVSENALARYLVDRGRLDDAHALSLRAIDEDPSCWACYATLAAILEKRGDVAEAVQAQTLAVNLVPEGMRVTGFEGRLRRYDDELAELERRAGASRARGASLSEEIVRAVERRRLDAYRRCYEVGLARAPGLAGRITVRFLIQLDGSVTSLADEGSTLPDPATVACVVGELAALRFPAREAGGSQLVVRSFNFSRAGLRSPRSPTRAAPSSR